MTTMWHFDIVWQEKVVRTIVVYVFLLIGLRLAGKRELGQFNPFDLVVLLLLSNTLQNAIIGNDNSLAGGLLGAGVLLAVNYAVVRFLYRHPAIERLVEGDPDVLVQNGETIQHRMERELITRDQLEAAARRQGIESLDRVRECRLETGGALTFIERTPTEDEERHAALCLRLNDLSEQLSLVNSQLRALQTQQAPARPEPPS